jgi:hypothetical protein
MSDKRVPRVALGRTGMQVSILGMGCSPIGHSYGVSTMAGCRRCDAAVATWVRQQLSAVFSTTRSQLSFERQHKNVRQGLCSALDTVVYDPDHMCIGLLCNVIQSEVHVVLQHALPRRKQMSRQPLTPCMQRTQLASTSLTSAHTTAPAGQSRWGWVRQAGHGHGHGCGKLAMAASWVRQAGHGHGHGCGKLAMAASWVRQAGHGCGKLAMAKHPQWGVAMVPSILCGEWSQQC